MASPFSEGLMAGYSVLETMRDRREARANEARRISLAEAANARANDIFAMGTEDRARGIATEERARRTASARARVLRDPDNVDDDDLAILEDGGDAETIAALENYAGRRDFTTRSLRDVAALGAQGGSGGGGQATPSRSGGVAQFTPGEEEFLSPSAETELAPDQFPQPGMIPIEEIADFMSPDDPAFRLARARGLDLSTPEGRAQARESGRRSGTRVPVPPGVLSASEIESRPIHEQEALRARNKELLGNRQASVENLSPRPQIFNARVPGKQQIIDDYSAMLDARVDSPLRELATKSPTTWIAKYHHDRNTLDDNTRALVDRRAAEIATQSLANIRDQVRSIPAGPDGQPDFSSPQAQAVKQNLEMNIAVLSQVEKGFSAADAAGIRGGYMPVGNRALTERVTEQWQSQPMPARPATATEERLLRTDLQRLDGAGGSRRISSASIDRFGKAVARGWIDYKDAESILLTGRVPQAAMQFSATDPKNDVWINGRLVRRGFDATAAAEARAAMQEDQLKLIQQQMELLYPGDEDWQKEERGRRTGQFLTQQWQQRQAIQDRHGFDPLAADPQQTAAMVNAFAAQDKADNAWDRSWLGMRRWMFGPMEDQAAPMSNEAMQLTRDFLPDQYGVYTLGDKQFDAERARRVLMASGEPTDRAAVIATEGDDAALMQYVEQKIAEQQQGQ